MAEPPVLPDNVVLTYLNEGAANVVYRISVPSSRPRTPQPSVLEEYGDDTPPPSEIEPENLQPDSSSPSMFDGKLLRVRKDLPTTLPCAVSQENWFKLVAPLFSPGQVLEQFLVQLKPGNIISNLNSELQALETGADALRPAKRRGTYLADDEYGLLVTDMTPKTTSDEVYEFKPKWLLQSPSAPKDAVRCRQCARNAKENTTRKSQGLLYKKFLCPLDLVSDDPRAVSLAVSLMADTPDQTERIERWLRESSLLKDLRRLQAEMDPLGIFRNKPPNTNFLIAMTLRDCTVFLRFPSEARLGDLDVKSPDKEKYWRETEQDLIDRGYYHGTENEAWSNDCALGPRQEERFC